MPSDYAAIREANKEEYGNVGRWGRDVLVNRYDSNVHFLFEILQNAEDALKRRKNWNGSHRVQFELTQTSLRIIHCGNPFTFKDVKGVCGVGETTKDLTDIGRFGIGFKSVYSITDRPEVHSGDEDFAIDSFVLPVAASPTMRAEDQTEIVLPLRKIAMGISDSISESLGQLGARTLLFLRHIDGIEWIVNGTRGTYLKSKTEDSGDGGHRVTLLGQRSGESIVEETWLVFSQEAKTDAGTTAGFIEVAFLLEISKDSKQWAIKRVDESPLNVFFPTIVTTHLGFLLQGPYRTTPSRDNVPARDPWNVNLVHQTIALLLASLRALKSQNLLDVAALQCLPIDRCKYPEGSMFKPLCDAVRSAMTSEAFLPCAGGGWTSAKNARLARTQELRDLFDSKQLSALLETSEDVHWLSGDITRDAASEIRYFLIHELGVAELTPETIVSRINRTFLEAQSNDWILRLYEFLGNQPALVRQGKLSTVPLVRVENGTHVVAELNGQPQAFLPSTTKTDFPTVQNSVCSTAKSLDFLKTLGLTEPDAVDDVVRNIIPKYKKEICELDDREYAADILRIVNAFGTQHRGHRDKLIAGLKDARFVKSIDTGNRSQQVSKPGDVYLATERLKELFDGVTGVILVDDSITCLRGEGIRDLLEACGVSRGLTQEIVACDLTQAELHDLRKKSGHEDISWEVQTNDYTLRGLSELLAFLPTLNVDGRRKKTKLLWEALKEVDQRLRSSAFTGSYSWKHHQIRSTTFDAAFVRKLNATAWVPDAEGIMQRPEFIVFESLGWEDNPVLTSKIRFKPPIIDQLALVAGIEPKVLEILKRRGLTSATDLWAALGGEEETKTTLSPSTPPETRHIDNSTVGETNKTHHSTDEDSASKDLFDGGIGGGVALGVTRSRTPGSAGGRPFISYIAASPEEDHDSDPNSLNQEARMALESKAIDLILSKEPEWQRTPILNRGFDLFQGSEQSTASRWCEVKAMTGRLVDRPVGISRAQFEWANAKGKAYWLYVVECAGTDEANLVRIQDPIGKARTFTFDHGWLCIAAESTETGEQNS